MSNEDNPHERPTGFPEPPGVDPEDHSTDRDPHHALNNPVGEPDPTEWPDPYETRPDPLDLGQTGSISTSEPHPSQDPEAIAWKAPRRDKLDD